MNGFVIVSLCVLVAVSAQQQNDWFASVCPYGIDTDLSGNVATCGASSIINQECPYTSDCEILFGSFGICCKRPLPPQQQCPNGAQHLPGVTCGGFVPQPCPNQRRYECIVNQGTLGICCPRSASSGVY